MPATERNPTVEARLCFTRPADVSIDDPERGLQRARTLTPAEMEDPRAFDRRLCHLHDLSAAGELCPDLRVHGFARVDLTERRGLQAALERVRAAGRVDDAGARAIRRRLVGRALPLVGGGRLRLLFIAREGFLMRRAGPNGLRVHGDAPRRGMNGHDAAFAVHADQDVEGTPLRQLMRGLAPRLFHHDSPDRSNRRSRLFLLNLWIPLTQVTRPLALMDARTLERRTHQLRYGLPTDSFLERRPDMRRNDIWTFLHDDAQRWYFSSAIDARTAYVFSTLSAPHSSCVLPGEARAEAGYLQLQAAIDALDRGDPGAAARALAPPDDQAAWPQPVSEPLRRAIAAIEALRAEGRALLGTSGSGDKSAWRERARAAAERVVRSSLEMRAIALLTPPAQG